MKKISFIILASLAYALLLNSCVKDEEDIFDESSSVRMTEQLQNVKDILTSATNGWLMDYYPEEDHSIGGYAIICAFNDDMEVTAASEIQTNNFDPGQQATSLYGLISDRGPVLSFNTYNEIFHYFSEPSSQDTNGMQGDYEFVILNATPDSIVMKGKKYGNRILMTPLASDANWPEYLTDVMQISENSGFGTYKIIIDGKEVAAGEQTDRTMTFISADTLQTESFVYTNDGIRFYQPVLFSNTTFSELTWNDDEKLFSSSDGSVKIVVNLPDGYIYYNDYIGDWVLEYGSSSARATVQVEIIQNQKNKSYTVQGLDFEFVLTYNLKNGMISYLTQDVGEYEGLLVKLAPWDTQQGYLTWTQGIGANGVVDQTGETMSISFVDNGVWANYNVSGFLFWTFDNGNSAGIYSGGNARFSNPVLIKK